MVHLTSLAGQGPSGDLLPPLWSHMLRNPQRRGAGVCRAPQVPCFHLLSFLSILLAFTFPRLHGSLFKLVHNNCIYLWVQCDYSIHVYNV